jgi:hypothetical protein
MPGSARPFSMFFWGMREPRPARGGERNRGLLPGYQTFVAQTGPMPAAMLFSSVRVAPQLQHTP